MGNSVPAFLQQFGVRTTLAYRSDVIEEEGKASSSQGQEPQKTTAKGDEDGPSLESP